MKTLGLELRARPKLGLLVFFCSVRNPHRQSHGDALTMYWEQTQDGIASAPKKPGMVSLVMTLWHLTQIYPCSPQVWSTYCSTSPFGTVFASTDLQSTYDSVNSVAQSANLEGLLAYQVDYFASP